MNKLIVILLLATMVFSSCGRRVYLNESKKISVSKKHKRSPRNGAGSDFWITLLIVVPNVVFFGSTIASQSAK